MNCMNCGAFLTDMDLDYCPNCGYNVLIQKKVDYLSKVFYNQGLEKAQGEYVLFLDSDDYYDPDTCRDLFELMEHTQADLCCYGYQIETQERQVVRIPHITDREYMGEAFRKEFVPHYFGDQPEKDELRGFLLYDYLPEKYCGRT